MEINIYDVIDGAMAHQFKASMDNARGPVTLAINSGGGSCMSGFAMYNRLAAYKSHTTARIDGYAASMATVLALSAKHVSMANNAWFMIHNCWTVAAGGPDEMRTVVDLLEKTKNQIRDVYVKKTGLSEAEISDMMDAETWMTASEALEKGFVDEVFDAGEDEATFGSGSAEIFAQYKNVPAAIAAKFSAPVHTPQQPTANVNKLIGELTASMDQKETFTADEATRLFMNTASTGANAENVMQELQNVFQIANQSGLTADQLQAAKDELLSGAIGINQFRKKVNAEMSHITNGNLISDSIRSSLEARLGHQQAEADNRYQGMPLFELARASLQDRGVSLSGMNKMEIAATAFTHSKSDFASILIDAANKSMLKGWDESPETFDKWTRAGNLPDFRPGHRVGLEAFPTLRKVLPGAEYKYVTLNDRGEEIVLLTYGELFSINREAIINDDLGVLDTIPAGMARAAKATIGDLVYAVLTGNPALSDGIPLFDDAHGNLISGDLSIDTLSTARSTMRRQRSSSGRILNIAPAFVIVPVAQETLAEQLLKSVSLPGAEYNAGVSNPFQNKLSIIAEPRLDEASEADWFLSAEKGRDTIEVAYLGGKARPHLEAQSGFTVDGVTMKVRIDAGVAPMDYRGMMKSTSDQPS
jgi:ATP-dependent protease ClpP protease subunit